MIPKLAIIGLALLPPALVAAGQLVADVPAGFFTRDPTTTLGGHPLTGALSTLGVLGWWSAATAAALTWRVAVHRGAGAATPAFFASAALLTAAMAFDDVYLGHDFLLPRELGIPEPWVLIALALGALAFLVAFRGHVRRYGSAWFWAAGGCFALSLGVDQVQELWGSPWRIVFEDGAKWMGIVFWAAFVLRAAWTELALSGGSPDPAW